MTHTVVGLFDDKEDARSAMRELTESGFMQENIDLSNRRDNMSNTSSMSSAGSSDTMRSSGSQRDAGESMGDKVSDFFSSLFGSDTDDARTYSDAAQDTQAILTVQADSAERAQKAAEILDRNGSIDVDQRAQQFRSGAAGNMERGTQDNSTERSDTTGRINIPVIEEDLKVGKRAVEHGGVRVRSRIVERPVEETVRLREEHVIVNRQPVNRPVSADELDNFKEGEFELTEHSEEAVVSKQARVTENIEIGKEVQEREQVVKDKVRRTDVNVDKTDDNYRSKGANR